MSFLKSIFGKKEVPVKSYSDFWNWFSHHEKDFFNVVSSRKESKEIEKGFFEKLSLKLGELKDGYFYLTGMFDDNIVCTFNSQSTAVRTNFKSPNCSKPCSLYAILFDHSTLIQTEVKI